MKSYYRAIPILFLLPHVFPAAEVHAQELEYRLLATNRTSTMEEEMNEAADAGYRVGPLIGGETAFGGREAVVIMYRSLGDDSRAGRYEYRLLATNRTSTMEEELREAGASGFEYVGQTVFRSAFGGRQVAVVVERDRQTGPREYEYRLLATNRTSTMQEELDRAGEDNFVLMGLSVNRTAFGGNEVVLLSSENVTVSVQ